MGKQIGNSNTNNIRRIDKMVFGLFRRKDPVCGMKEEKGQGMDDKETGRWFCSSACRDNYCKALKKQSKKEKPCCCH